MARHAYRVGDWVVYHKTKVSTSPGPRARCVVASQHGDDYSYVVNKFWVVAEVRANGMLVLVTKRGKQRIVNDHDPNLRRAKWWERFWFVDRYRAVQRTPTYQSSQSSSRHPLPTRTTSAT